MTRFIVIAGYLVIVAVAICCEIYAQHRPNKFAPIGDMLEHVMTSRTTRVSVIAAWWWFGWHFAFADTVQLEL
ncbi:DUF6186 family protein [Aurantimicrobium sp. MWH-Uga1]|uniref:DUF6186 family protein n=1 Tax=Aurantimicrobium sp. MWH-Uga1 TaxID=2079575 RepID=UPI000DED846B|nr:DUF6186 family protein [Aurantimicrobium sp. MWH-Uga1]AXE54155.1 hypothetical protein AURUGA1_00448 [Aurantimicrobium sp. MWH-Uga1]